MRRKQWGWARPVAARLGRPLGGPPWRGLLRPATGLNGSARVTVGRLGDPNPPPPREPPPLLGLCTSAGRRHVPRLLLLFSGCCCAGAAGVRRQHSRWCAPPPSALRAAAAAPLVQPPPCAIGAASVPLAVVSAAAPWPMGPVHRAPSAVAPLPSATGTAVAGVERRGAHILLLYLDLGPHAPAKVGRRPPPASSGLRRAPTPRGSTCLGGCCRQRAPLAPPLEDTVASAIRGHRRSGGHDDHFGHGVLRVVGDDDHHRSGILCTPSSSSRNRRCN